MREWKTCNVKKSQGPDHAFFLQAVIRNWDFILRAKESQEEYFKQNRVII